MSTGVATEYTSAMTTILRLELSVPEKHGYQKATEIVLRQGQKPLDICELHRVMFPGDKMAGVYRTTSVMSLNGTDMIRRDFPKFSSVPQLMYSFRTAYHNALRGSVPSTVVNFDRLAWLVAANGRCLHPFVQGNTRLFLLVENHIRQVHGLPWTIGLREKAEFQTFRQTYKKIHAEHFEETSGA